MGQVLAFLSNIRKANLVMVTFQQLLLLAIAIRKMPYEVW